MGSFLIDWVLSTFHILIRAKLEYWPQQFYLTFFILIEMLLNTFQISAVTLTHNKNVATKINTLIKN